MVVHAKVTDSLEWGTIEHLVKRQIPHLLVQLGEKASDLDEQDGDEVWVSGEFLADMANALDAAQEQLRAIRPYLREAVSVEAVARHGREELWDTLPEQARRRHLEAARDVIAASGFTPVDSATVREIVDLECAAMAIYDSLASYGDNLPSWAGLIYRTLDLDEERFLELTKHKFMKSAEACAKVWGLQWRRGSDE